MNRKSICVLLIEDSATDVHLIQGNLKHSAKYTFEVLTAATIKEAEERLYVRLVDAVLLDLGLPDSNREQSLLWMLRQDIPVVVITADEDDKTLSEVFHNGAQDYLVKSRFSPEELVRSIIYSIERHRITKHLLFYQGHLERMVKDRVSEIVKTPDQPRPVLEPLLGEAARKALLGIAPAYIFWKDLRGVYLGCNERFSRFVANAAVADILGKTDRDFDVLRDCADALKAQDERVFTTAQTVEVPKEDSIVFAAGHAGRMIKTPLLDYVDGHEEIVGVLTLCWGSDMLWQNPSDTP